MEKSKALELWKLEMKNKEYAYDFAGRKIVKSDYNIKNQVGWVVGYLRPLELGGKDYDGNTIIMHHNTFEEKGLNYPEFEIMNKKYKVMYDENDDLYYLEKLSKDDNGLI